MANFLEKYRNELAALVTIVTLQRFIHLAETKLPARRWMFDDFDHFIRMNLIIHRK